MDIDLGPVVLLVFIALAAVFLAGFAVVFAAMILSCRMLRREPLRSRPLFLLLVIALSVLGGFAAVRLLYLWDRAEENAFWAKREAFTAEMAQRYPLEMRYEPLKSQPFTIKFGLPVNGIYHLHVIGYAGDQADGSGLWDDKVVEVHSYFVPFSAGTHEVSFGFLTNVSQTEIQSVNLIVVIQPAEPTRKLLSTQKGIAVTNPGSVVLTDGIDYYSPDLYAMNGCLSNIYQWVPCVEDDQLHVEISR